MRNPRKRSDENATSSPQFGLLPSQKEGGQYLDVVIQLLNQGSCLKPGPTSQTCLAKKGAERDA